MPVRIMKNVGILLGHTLVALLGTAILTNPLWRLFHSNSAGGVIRKEWILSVTCSSALGFLMYGMSRSRLGIWVWVLPTVWFVLGALSLLASGRWWYQLSGSDCVNRVTNLGCAHFFSYTVPFIRSIAYSIGTLVGVLALPAPISDGPLTVPTQTSR
jgi:hypothetical protein